MDPASVRRALQLPTLLSVTSWSQVPERLRSMWSYVWRLTTAGVISYLLTVAATHGPTDLTGALTSLLVVQTSAYSTVRMGLVRVGAVLTGVFIAVGVSSVVGLHWWSLALVIGSALVAGQLFRLGEQSLETPISAMLILGVGAAGREIAVDGRIVTTLIGAAVGVCLSLLLPQRVPTRTAIGAVGDVADAEADVIAAAARWMDIHPVTRTVVQEWAEQASRIDRLVTHASERVVDVKEIRRLNSRAIGTADVEPALRSGLDALARTLRGLRALFVVMATEAPAQPTPDDGYGEEVRAAFAVVLHELAHAVRSFGGLVEAEATGGHDEVEDNLEGSLQVVRETKAILTEMMLVDARAQTSLWLLRGSILVAVGEIVAALDLEDRARRRTQWTSAGTASFRSAGTVLAREMLAAPGLRILRPHLGRERTGTPSPDRDLGDD